MIKHPLVEQLLLNILEDKKNIEIIECLNNDITTDEEIAEKTGIKVNLVRKYLYNLYDYKLASYKRYKDPETQWYTYEWKFDEDEVVNRITEDSQVMLKQLKEELEKEETNMFFICPQGHYRLSFEDASELEFICPECGEEMIFHDNTQIINDIKNDIDNIENGINSFKKTIK